MKIAVWDTYVQREDGATMHFDILVPDETNHEEAVFNFGETYLQSKPFKTASLTAKECRLCHSTVWRIQVIGFLVGSEGGGFTSSGIRALS